MGRKLSLLYGFAVYGIFLGVFAYTIGFVGNLVVPKSIDSGSAGAWGAALGIDVALLLLFAVQHSVMARPGFKRWWTRIVPEPIERSTFVLLASAMLILLFWLWQPLPRVVWHVEQPAAAAALWALFGLGWLIVYVSAEMIGNEELFGLAQVRAWHRGREHSPGGFRTPGFYRHVRHPINLGFLIAFWATPEMSVGHLLLAMVWTAYVLVAMRLEERDLIAAFGDLYRVYQQRVPGLVPRPGRSWSEDDDVGGGAAVGAAARGAKGADARTAGRAAPKAAD